MRKFSKPTTTYCACRILRSDGFSVMATNGFVVDDERRWRTCFLDACMLSYSNRQIMNYDGTSKLDKHIKEVAMFAKKHTC